RSAKLRYMFDRESAMKVDGRLQDALFLMAVSNSCMNPLVYGSYAMNFRKECRNCFCYLFKNSAATTLDGKSTDVGNQRVFQVPLCFVNLFTAGSGVTKCSAVAGLGGSLHGSRNRLVVNKKYDRPVSADGLVVGSGRYLEPALPSDEFHSEPAAPHHLYLAVS
ncbi:hypothetical protein GE061_013664, partial [Apolygus lucorum]